MPQAKKVNPNHDRLKQAIVKHLREFGYPHANESNCLSDYVYGEFARRMLEGTAEDPRLPSAMVTACNELIAEIDAARAKDKTEAKKK